MFTCGLKIGKKRQGENIIKKHDQATICFLDVKYFIYTVLIELQLIYMYINSPFGAFIIYIPSEMKIDTNPTTALVMPKAPDIM